MTAARDAAGITVARWTHEKWAPTPQYAVFQDYQILNTFRTEQEAETFADELAADLIDAQLEERKQAGQ